MEMTDSLMFAVVSNQQLLQAKTEADMKVLKSRSGQYKARQLH